MNPIRTPTKTSSTPDLSALTDHPRNTSLRVNKRLRLEENMDDEVDLKQELKAITSLLKQQSLRFDDFEKLAVDFTTIKSHLGDIQATNKLLLEDHRKLTSEMLDIKKRNDETNSRVSSIEAKLTDSSATVEELTQQLRIKDQQSRMNNLEISGVPQLKGENLQTILHNIAVKVGYTLRDTDIDFIHRVRRYASVNNNDPNKATSTLIPNIIVRFTQRQRRNEMLAAVRVRRGLTTADVGIDGASKPIFVNEHLTPHNKMLHGRARRLGKEIGYKYIYTRDCKIFLRKTDISKPFPILSEEDLAKIV
ncbi:hypothetical protein JYU34_004130 [Plutella xylostella]|uniref:FP protein C-terminal domain-containing protein n=1 Tax=Plutella xylostella TaxID=51655 RepID=A0ABQ7QX66_PLUXY|nr:hypothetical protein JYU34_004130 [Plutella xylostella]